MGVGDRRHFWEFPLARRAAAAVVGRRGSVSEFSCAPDGRVCRQEFERRRSLFSGYFGDSGHLDHVIDLARWCVASITFPDSELCCAAL